MARKRKDTALPAPFLLRLTVKPEALADKTGYPFDLPFFDADFELDFEHPVTILVGENGAGKSTLIEAIAAIAGYDEAGGGKGYAPVDHSMALDKSGSDLGDVLRASWLPKVTDGWFFRAETFFSVARHQDEMSQLYGGPAPNYLSHSHGEGFVRFFDDRLSRQGIYFMDEPESALSPKRQLDLLHVLKGIQDRAASQVIMATHSPILMAVPGAEILEITRGGLAPVALKDTAHFRLYRSFIEDPNGFVAEALDERTAEIEWLAGGNEGEDA
jgi:predicted ATPase